jgi:hypothetical protein
MPSTPVQNHRHTTRAQGARLLDEGDHGAQVRHIQELLNKHGAHLALDGDFGPKTELAVKAFQRANGLEVDGVVGPKTMAKLEGTSANRVPAGTGRAAQSDERDVGPTRLATGYRNGRPFQLRLASVGNGEWMSEKAARQFHAMRDAAARDGVHLNAISGFRSMEEQQALYRAYKSGHGNLAAVPGHSNHQSGIAMDIETGGSRNSASYRWLRQHAGEFGFRNTVASEPWHWEYRG